ncbi:MAG: hypothetical protein V7647_2823 [Acidobacteriota bacterium]
MSEACAAAGSRAGGQRRAGLIAALYVTLAVQAAAGIDVSLTQSDTQRALRLGDGTPAALAAFHAPYVIAITDSIVREIQVLTEFRRTVMATEDALKRGDWAVAKGARSLNGRGIDDVVKPWRGKVTILATLQLDALHTYVALPNCELMMGGMPVVASLDRRSTPRASLPYSMRGTMTTSLVGGVIEADFDAAAVGQTSRSAVVMCDGRDVARTPIDFSRLE